MNHLKALDLKTWKISRAILAFLLVGCVGCSRDGDTTHGAATVREGPRVLRLATTTSTRDSGLLDMLLPKFEKQHDCRVDVVAVGTGAALKLGERGDADVVMVHDRESETSFMKAGHGVRHEEFMYNEFVILGPPADPARVAGLDPFQALTSIAKQAACFVSRGDESGTHKRELRLWEGAGGKPYWDDYVECGQGMGPTLIMADEMQGYVLADISTYLKFQRKLDLVPLVTDSTLLRNPYAAIVVTPKQPANEVSQLANALLDFLVSPDSQRMIADYEVAGRSLFTPSRPPAED